MAKVVAPNMALRVIDRAIQAFGAKGVSDDTFLAARLRQRAHAAARRRARRSAPRRDRQGRAREGEHGEPRRTRSTRSA